VRGSISGGVRGGGNRSQRMRQVAGTAEDLDPEWERAGIELLTDER
jgi:hypothetical protein